MIIFRKVRDDDNQFDTTNITIESDAQTLPDVLEDFKGFLMACGYYVNPGDSIVIESEDE